LPNSQIQSILEKPRASAFTYPRFDFEILCKILFLGITKTIVTQSKSHFPFSSHSLDSIAASAFTLDHAA
jgi:hypothetical protein